jgi:3-hydroxy acid dehydrogenase/malonic semialdehyde reductase
MIIERPTVMLTGAAGGMGIAIATAFVERGHKVVLVDRDENRLNELQRRLGPSTTSIVLDITDAKRTASLPDLVPEAFRPIGILVNNAGHDIGGHKPFHEGSADDWAAIIDTNMTGTVRVTRAMLTDMVKRNTGDIIFMSSVAAIRIRPTAGPYNATKAGLHMLIDILRAELMETGIRICEIQPGLTKTNIIATSYRGDKAMEEEYFDRFKIVLDPDDVARAVLYAAEQPRHMQVATMTLLPINRA